MLILACIRAPQMLEVSRKRYRARRIIERNNRIKNTTKSGAMQFPSHGRRGHRPLTSAQVLVSR